MATHSPPATGQPLQWHTLLGAVLDIPTHQKLIQDKEGFFKVEDDVKLTYSAKVLVQELYISVDQLQYDQFIVLALDGAAEIETGGLL